MPPAARVLSQAQDIPETDLVDWGPVPEPIGKTLSKTSGKLLHRDENGDNETGVWVCTPGRWRCEVGRAEFCHFLSGHALYESDDGVTIEVRGGDAAFFPAGWAGTCEVRETVRKTYMIR